MYDMVNNCIDLWPAGELEKLLVFNKSWIVNGYDVGVHILGYVHY